MSGLEIFFCSIAALGQNVELFFFVFIRVTFLKKKKELKIFTDKKISENFLNDEKKIKILKLSIFLDFS